MRIILWGINYAPEVRRALCEPKEAAGDLRVTLNDERICRIEFTPIGPEVRFDVHVAVLGGGFISKVTRGENRGETLPQEFVALSLSDRPLVQTDSIHQAEITLPATTITDGSRRAIAILITRRGEMSAAQSAGGWLN